MRQITALTAHQIASGLAKAEHPSNPNQPPPDDRVGAITHRLVELADALGFDPNELRGDQPVILQDAYLENPVPEVLDHEGDLA